MSIGGPHEVLPSHGRLTRTATWPRRLLLRVGSELRAQRGRRTDGHGGRPSAG